MTSFTAIGAALDVTELRLGIKALDGDDFIVYDSATGRIFYDADANGTGAKQLLAVVADGTILTISDFTMY